MNGRRSSLAASLLAALAGLTGSAFADAPEAQTGTWQEHKYSFQFLGFTSTYSCDGLADKLRLLLIASGARGDLKAAPGACASGFGRPDKFSRADLTFSTLSPAPGANVPGQWHGVVLETHRPFDLGIGDCELVEQFKAQLLPMFVTRNVESRTSCIPNQASGSVISLRFDSFAAVPAPGVKPGSDPGR